MATIEDLNKNAIKNQIQPKYIYREYCQNIFLSFLYQQKKSKQLLFIGGTALRIVYNSPRYSEDLDFTIIDLTNNEIEDMMGEVLSQFEKMNLPTSIQESKETSGGYLADIEVRMQGETIRIAIQASRRSISDSKPDVTLVENTYIPPYTVFMLSQNLLVKEKIQAAQDRKKPRDFFDIYFLLRARMINPEYRALLKNIPALLEKEQINFQKELKVFLPQNHWPIIRGFKNILIREMSRYG